ncbi:DMT family transporter [Vibrio antiquarius]|uniref:DMT family transporter n=1 Tax=Vibrio antiquarius (strain Ex25) TaxID=150340 RepID=UPI002659FE85|nr:DMT family transporter [Vibrio antiquarius]MCR9548630.1 DMT family transporter [Vibrio antiquarius]
MSKHLSIWCGVVVAIFFWSSNFNVIKAISSDVSPLDSATLRFSVAALILLLIRGTKRSPYGSKLTRKSMLSLFVIATVGVTIQNFSAMNFTTPVNAAVVQANLPLVTILLSGFILKTSISVKTILGALISFCGVVIVITGGNIHSIGSNSNIGDLYMLFALISGCLYTILAKRLTSHIPVTQQLRWVLSIGAIQMVAIAIYHGDFSRSLNTITFKDLSLIAYMSLFGTLIAYYFWMKGAIVLGPDKMSPLFNTMPVFTLLISFISGEQAQWENVLGVFIVAAGVYIGNSAPFARLRRVAEQK